MIGGENIVPLSFVKLNSSKEWSGDVITFDLDHFYRIVIRKTETIDYSAQFLLRGSIEGEYRSVCTVRYLALDRKTAVEKAVIELYADAAAHIELMKTVQYALEVRD